MGRWKKVLLWVLALLLGPWLILIIAAQMASLFLSTSAEAIILNLESVRNWVGLKAIGVTLSVALLFYGKPLLVFMTRSRVQKPKSLSRREFDTSIKNAVDQYYWLLVALIVLVLSHIVLG